jgi:serine/threonine-protein kinase
MSVVGDLLAGRYELQSRLGRGGMAEVYRAVDKRLGREVAVKVLADHLLSDPRSVQRFQREGRTAAALNHPNVVDVYDAASEGDTHYLVMELIEGPTLAQIIASEGPLAEPRALNIASRIAAALQAAHDRGMVHHDIKPSNVLFDSDGNVKVTDFGIARAASSNITTVQGSPPYVAPEQARGGLADPRSDIYGLGCVLFDMLTGRPPFTGDSASEVIMQHLESPPPRVSDFRGGASSHIDALVKRALAKDPAQRYPSAQEFRSDIDRVANGLPPAAQATIVSTRHLDPGPTVALGAHDEPARFEPPREPTREYTNYLPPDSPPPTARRRRPRRPGLQAITVAVLLVLLALLAYAAWTDSRLRDRPAEVTDSQPQEQEADQDPPPEDEGPPPEADADDESGSTLGRAADRFRSLMERGREADQATQRAIDELQRELEEAVARQRQGDSEGASDRIQNLRDRLDELTDQDQIGSELADRLRDLINDPTP